MYTVGIDIGSVATKSIVYNGSIAARIVIPTGWSPREASQQALHLALERTGITRDLIRSIVATGYGRVSADFADTSVTEITCHARGAFHQNPCIRTILDIGGQDSKVIKIDDRGNVIDFSMNDKCAAGTGRFLEIMARILETDIADLDALACQTDECAPISSMCTVFAESEVVSLLAQGISRASIARGVFASIAGRVMTMLSRFDEKGAIAFTGGLARSSILKHMIETKTEQPLFTCDDAQLAGALGGAVIGWHEGKQNRAFN